MRLWALFLLLMPTLGWCQADDTDENAKGEFQSCSYDTFCSSCFICERVTTRFHFFSVCFKGVRHKYEEGQNAYNEEQCIDELKNCFQDMTRSLIG